MESISIIENKILMIRGQRVMLDSDLAFLYGVQTKRLNEQVQRNIQRFPADFMFQLSTEELVKLNRSQIATGSQKHRDPKFLPYVFTEHGVAMLSGDIIDIVSVLRRLVDEPIQEKGKIGFNT